MTSGNWLGILELSPILIRVCILFSHLTRRSRSSCVLTTASRKYVIKPINTVFHLFTICNQNQIHKTFYSLLILYSQLLSVGIEGHLTTATKFQEMSMFLPPAYVVRWEGNVLTCVCPSIHLSICLSTGGTGYPYPIMLCNISQNAMGQTPGGGGTLPGPAGGVPCQIHLGGTLPGGYPAGGGYPGRTAEGVLNTWRAVPENFEFFFLIFRDFKALKNLNLKL